MQIKRQCGLVNVCWGKDCRIQKGILEEALGIPRSSPGKDGKEECARQGHRMNRPGRAEGSGMIRFAV